MHDEVRADEAKAVLLQFFHSAGALAELQDLGGVVCGRMHLVNMGVEIATGTRHVVARGAR